MAISNELASAGTSNSRQQGHRGTAFLVEALVVLAFLMVSLAVFVQLFSMAQIEGVSANNLSQAALLASSCAEEFSANPKNVAAKTDEAGFVVTCDVKPTAQDAGTLYEATITVSKDDAEVYTLSTSRYVSNTGGDAR